MAKTNSYKKLLTSWNLFHNPFKASGLNLTYENSLAKIRIKNVSFFVAMLIFLMSYVPSNAAVRIWTGATNADWTLASNWNGPVPNPNDDVRIPGGLSNYPIISTIVSVKSIQINNVGSGANLMVLPGANLTLSGANADYKFVSSGGTLIQSGGTITTLSRKPTIEGTFEQFGGSFFSDQDINLTGVINQDDGLIHMGKDLATNPNKKINFDNGTINQNGGTISIRDHNAKSGSFNQTDTDALLKIFHDWKPTSNHTFNATAGTVQFTGSAGGGASFISENTQFHSILVDAGVTPRFDKAANSPIKISGDFTNNNSTLDNSANASFTFNGTGPQIITSASTNNNTTFGNLTIDNSSGIVSFASNINIEEGLTVMEASTLDLSTFTLGAQVPINSIVLESGASIIGSGTLSLGSNVMVNAGGPGSIGANILSAIDLGANRIFTVADDGTSEADLTIGGVISGAYDVTKNGLGKMVLSGVNTYSGNTIVTAGSIELGATDVIPDGSNLVLNGGTFSTGSTSGFSETLGTLSVGTNSSITLGSEIHTLSFASSNNESWQGGTVTINGWTGAYDSSGGTTGKIEFGSSTNGLTATQVAKIRFYDGTDYYQATMLSSGEIVATSELYLTLDLSYPTPGYFVKGIEITPLTPTVSGIIDTYIISPQLPDDLVINSSSGVISGKPKNISDPQIYTVTATGPDGSSTFDITIAIGDKIETKGSGNWSSTVPNAPWKNGTVPKPWDYAIIKKNNTVTVDINDAACAYLLVGKDGEVGYLDFSGSNPHLTVSNNVDVGNPQKNDRVGVITFSSDATLTAGSVTINRSTKNGESSEINMISGGTLVTGSFIVGGDGPTGIWTPGTGTVEMTATNTLPSSVFTSFYNLQINSGNTTTGVEIPTVSGSLTVKAGTSLSMDHSIGATVPPLSTELDWGLEGSTISGAGTLSLGGPVNVNYISGGAIDAKISVPVDLGASRTFTVVGDVSASTTGLTVSNVISGPGSGITKAGTGTMLLSGSNSYSGVTKINDGILAINTIQNVNGGNSSLGSPTTVTEGTVDISGTGILKYTGSGSSSNRAIQLTGSGASIDASGNGLLSLGGGVTGNSNELILTGSGVGELNGAVESSSGTITKNGIGTWALSASNTYTGGTTINSGTLTLGASDVLADTGPLSLNGGTFSTGITTGFNETLGTLSLTENAVIDMGTGVHNINFAASNGISWTSGKTITITGWSGDYNGTGGTDGKIFIGTSASDITETQLNQIYFFNGVEYYGAQILSSGEIVAAPPANTISTGTIVGSPFCAGSDVTVPYTVAGVYSTGNEFTAQLSDAGGNFTSPVSIGSVSSITSGSVLGTLPIDAVGSFYRIRVVSSAPNIIGTPNDSDFTITVTNPVSIIVTASENPVCAGETVTFTAIPTNGGSNPFYQWNLNGLQVGTNSNIYTTDALVDGDIIFCTMTSDAPCTSGIPVNSNSVTMTVTPAPIAAFSYTGTPYCQWGSNPFPTFSNGGFAGVFSSTSGLIFVSTATGEVDLALSTPGDYIVTNTIISSGDCGTRIATSPISIHTSLNWTGALSSDWNDVGNWSCGMIPDITRPIQIPDVPNKPVLNTGSVGTISDLIIDVGASLTVVDNTIQISGNITNNGEFNASEGTIEMIGPTSQSIGASLFTGNTINGLIINNSAGVTLEGTLDVTGIVSLTNGTLVSDGNLTLVSTATQTALVDGSGTGLITGEVTIQRYLASSFGYKYFSSPVQGATVIEFDDDMDLTASFPTLYSYDESKVSSGWVDYTDVTGILYTMQGYAVNFGPNITPITVDISGVLNNGNLQRTMYNNNNPYTKGFNLIGNPYPSPIDWNATSGWTRTNIDDALYFFKSGGYDQYSGTYHTYINGISSDGMASNQIPSMQGFFIHVSDGVWPVTGVLGMTNEVRVNNSTQEFLKSENFEPKLFVRLQAQFTDIQKSTDAMVIYFDENATSNFDKKYDALKLLNTDFFVPNYYTIASDNYNLSINALPTWKDSLLVVPAGIKILIDGLVKFSIGDGEHLPGESYVYLYDDLTKINHSLNLGKDYTIYLEAGEYDDRFFIKLTKGANTINRDNSISTMLSASSFNGRVRVDVQLLEESKGVIQITSMSGQPVYSEELYESGNYEFDPQLRSGIYIVSFRSGSSTKSKKVFISTK